MITVVGLGNQKGDLTKRGEDAILSAQARGYKIFARTANTASFASVRALGVEVTPLDSVYEKSRSFTTLARNLAKAVKDGGENSVYLVDGSATEDFSVKALCRICRGRIEIIDGVSKVSAFALLADFSSCSYTAVSAYELFEYAELVAPLIVYDLDDRAFASDAKLRLFEAFGEETEVRFIQGGKVKKIPLYELDRQKKYDYSTALAIEKRGLTEKARFNLSDLEEIIVRLRRPDGCPWDRVQTNDSIKMSVVEEAYELVDAIDQNDDDKILEEAGDIMLQAVFHAVLKSETGAFNLSDVLTGICTKLITRHTHVFGQDKASDDQSALRVWEKNKMTEKGQVTYADAVNDVPKCFPAAMRAQKVGKRAAKAGLDFADAKGVARQIQDELNEFFEAYEQGNATETEKELGDLLFACVSLGRKTGCDAEKALKESVERFAKRFTIAEALARQDHDDVTILSETEWDKYYKEAKRQCN